MKHWTVQDVMTRDVATVSPHASYREAVDVLVGRGVSAAPVVDADGHVLGVVSEADLLHKVEASDERDHRRVIRTPRWMLSKAHAATVEDLMTAPAVTTAPDTPVAAAARTLDHAHVKRMPVVGPDGRLVGIVSRRDLLRMHTRPDDDIRHEVADTVLLRTLWIDPSAVSVDVDRGTVTLTGRLENSSLARLVIDLTAQVAGVVTVVDQLRRDFDDRELTRSHGYPFGSAERLLKPGP